MEYYMRCVASDINVMLDTYDKKFPDKPELDKLVFVALNQTVGKLNALHRLEVLNSQETKLEKDLQGYLDKLETPR